MPVPFILYPQWLKECQEQSRHRNSHEGIVGIRQQLFFFSFKKLPIQRNGLPSQLSRRRQWQPTPVLLPGKSHGWRSLVGYSPWGCEESDTTERLHFHFSLSCIGEGNGHPLQCSCLENTMERRAWWAAVYGVAQSRTRLKQLSSSSSIAQLVKNLSAMQETQVRFLGWEVSTSSEC